MIDKNIGSVEIGGKYASKCPKQQNHCDCGLYLLHYSEVFLQRPGVLLDGILVRLELILGKRIAAAILHHFWPGVISL